MKGKGTRQPAACTPRVEHPCTPHPRPRLLNPARLLRPGKGVGSEPRSVEFGKRAHQLLLCATGRDSLAGELTPCLPARLPACLPELWRSSHKFPAFKPVTPPAAVAGEAEVELSLEGSEPPTSLLHQAAADGLTAAQQLLLALLPPGAAAAGLRKSALRLAVKGGREAAVRLLLAEVAEAATVGDGKGCTPMHLATEHGCTDILQLLLQAAPEKAVEVTADGSTPMHLAARNGAAVELLVAAAGPGTTTAAIVNGILAIHLAAVVRHTAVVRQLLDTAPQTAMAMVATSCRVQLNAATYRRMGRTRWAQRWRAAAASGGTSTCCGSQ